MSALAAPVMLKRLGEATVILNAETGQYYELNDTGADMLECWLQHEGDTGAVIAALKRRYAVSAAELEADLGDLLKQLAAAGIITECPVP